MKGSEYDLLLTGHRVVELAGETLKVTRLADGRMLKLFTIRLRFSKALRFPRAIAFARS